MIAENFGWIEIALVAILALGFGFWQLWSVNREIKRDKEVKSARDAASDPGHAIGKHELDDR